jgi:hypothetical protein
MTRKISDILWDAANTQLCPQQSHSHWETYSCLVIQETIGFGVGHIMSGRQQALDVRIHAGMIELGLDTGSTFAFSEFAPGPERQGARYAWLMFCHDLALEQGL